MALMMLLGREDVLFLWILLGIALVLTVTEAFELKLDTRMTLWWISIVAMLHVAGYLAMRAWGWQRKRELRGQSGGGS